MTRQRHLHRTAMIAAASAVVFAATATGSALAWNGSVEQVGAAPTASARAERASTDDAPATRATVAPAVRPAAVVRTAAKATVVVAKAATAKKTATKTAATPTATKPAAKAKAPTSVTISRYVDAPGSQAQIDKCKLVLWTHSPMWLAGHNWCGYQWMAFVKTGTTVKVTSGPAAGTYVVTGHKRLTRQSGSLPTLSADLVLQTCVGSGTGLTLLRRV